MKWWRIFFGSLVLAASLFFVSAVHADTTYTVQFGDTLWRIARRFNLMPEDIAAVNPKIVDMNLIYGGDVLVIPSNAPPVVDPYVGQGGIHTYVIRQGDTLFRIAQRYNTIIAAILALNSQIVDPHWIYAGRVLVIPGGEEGRGAVMPEVATNGSIYIVRPGDGLTGIARTFNTTVDILLVLNPQITNRHLIFVGDTIKLPEG